VDDDTRIASMPFSSFSRWWKTRSPRAGRARDVRPDRHHRTADGPAWSSPSRTMARVRWQRVDA
jgi:hypothetical protein